MTTSRVAEMLPLTSLRLFLATWIVLFHLWITNPPVNHLVQTGFHPVYNIAFCAYVAVGFFFVLSGFVLALNYPLDAPWGTGASRKFYAARFSRIYPVYLLSLILISPAILGQALAMPSHALLLRRLASGMLNLLMLQSWIPGAAQTWNGPGWSLSDEAFFYLCFPVLGAVIYKVSTPRKALALLLLLVALILLLPSAVVLTHFSDYGSYAATEQPEGTVASILKFCPLINLFIFLSGIALCRLYKLLAQTGSFQGRGYLFYAPSICLLLLLTVFGQHIPYPLMHSGLMIPPALGIILGLALGDIYLARLLSNKILVFLGKASYAEYLLHFPLRYAFERFKIGWTLPQQFVYVVTVLAVSSLVFKFYEEPLHKYLRKRLAPRPIQG